MIKQSIFQHSHVGRGCWLVNIPEFIAQWPKITTQLVTLVPRTSRFQICVWFCFKMKNWGRKKVGEKKLLDSLENLTPLKWHYYYYDIILLFEIDAIRRSQLINENSLENNEYKKQRAYLLFSYMNYHYFCIKVSNYKLIILDYDISLNYNYERAKRTKYILAVIYWSPGRH